MHMYIVRDMCTLADSSVNVQPMRAEHLSICISLGGLKFFQHPQLLSVP